MPPFGVVSTGVCRAEPQAMAPSLAAGILLPASGAGAVVEDLEHWLEEVRRTLSRLDSKRATLEGQIAAASRGRRRCAPRRAQASLPPADDDNDHDAAWCYTRKGAAGSVRRRLRAAAGSVKKEKERLEALQGDLQEAVVDARERLALQPAMN
ncbi:hypothetical protein HU200_060141 [Digitaria exilis]|uniref:Uncharacterized protein n=1 Tax=Digitaria exilis TaxID=1010633 RepID=A0A835AD19_9POAL|nr:hypothetical protein HU200_060141 [Digitaria exilis]